MVAQMNKIVCTPISIPRRAVLSYLLIVTFLMFLYFLRTIQLLHIFLRLFQVLLRELPQKETFLQHPPLCWKFQESFWGMLLFFWTCSRSDGVFKRCCLYNSHSQCTKKNSQYVSLCQGYYPIFQGLFWINYSMS